MDQLLGLLEIFMGAASSKSQSLSKQLLITARKIVIIIGIALAAVVLFCVGVSMAIIDLSREFENATLVGSILAAISLCVFLFCLSQRSWLKAAAIKEEPTKSATSPIEEALALLIKDLVEERQLKRTIPQNTENPTL
ncbi:MAG: hypothetical protein H0V66_07045 [Bdellovibrionales bacterium]|nr:hypothetical protein [Bdellovibrionales bacterium]